MVVLMLTLMERSCSDIDGNGDADLNDDINGNGDDHGDENEIGDGNSNGSSKVDGNAIGNNNEQVMLLLIVNDIANGSGNISGTTTHNSDRESNEY